MTSWSAGSYVTAWLMLVQLMMELAECSGRLSTTDCPATCFCNALSRIVYCSRRALDAVPTSLPHLTLQLNVNGNHFRSRVLRRVNFSSPQAANIEHLYLSDCGIQTLEVRRRRTCIVVYILPSCVGVARIFRGWVRQDFCLGVWGAMEGPKGPSEAR